MDEIEKIKEALSVMKETLMFLVDSESKRGGEVAALNEKIDYLNDVMENSIINPLRELDDKNRFDRFREKYADRLDKYDDAARIIENDPEYSVARDTWDAFNSSIPEEDRNEETMDKFVDEIEKGYQSYIEKIKAVAGIPEDEAVTISEDGNGNVEVKADENGDGVAEEVVATETEDEEAPKEEEVEVEVEDREPTPEELEAYLRGEN